MDETLVKESLRAIIDEVFPDGFLSELDHAEKAMSFPSVNGHFGQSRASGGGALEIGANWSHVQMLARTIEPEVLDRMTYTPHLGVLSAYRSPAVDTLMAERLMLGLEKQSDFDCTASFVLEPLKVRAVTAGPAVAYWLLRSVQKKCWSLMRRHPAFRLIGEPVTEELLNQRLSGFLNRSCPGDGLNLLSGDYQDATDGMRSWFSEVTWKLLAKKGSLPRWMTRLGRSALTGHTIHYLKKDLNVPPLKQRNGQLMGSILSFVVLCLVNAAICMQAYSADWEHSYETLRDSPTLINGDDCVMLYSAKQEKRWEELASLVGMKKSIGKCYSAADWLQINSTAFHFRPTTLFKRCAYINFGLLGPFKIRGSTRRTFLELESLASEFLKGHPQHRHHELMTLFIREHRKEGGLLNQAPKGISWWLPRHLGGLGLPLLLSPSEEKKYWEESSEFLPPIYSHEHPLNLKYSKEISGRQRMMATMVMNSLKTGERPIRPFPGVDTSLPVWLQKGLRLDSRYEIALPRGEFLSSLSAEEREALAQPYARVELGIGPYSSALWEQASSLSPDPELLRADPEVFPDDRRNEQEIYRDSMREILRCWERVWRSSRTVGPAPSEVLLSHEPHVHFFPGGLTAAMNKVRRLPRGLISRLSALQCVLHRESVPVHMKNSLSTPNVSFSWLQDAPSLDAAQSEKSPRAPSQMGQLWMTGQDNTSEKGGFDQSSD
jgi:hypothetical protein